jgi:hypothetical protein
MVEQVSRGVSNKRNGNVIDTVTIPSVIATILNVIDIVLNIAIVQTEKNAQASLGEDGVCGLESDVIAGDIHT